MTFRPPITDEATWEFIRTRIERQKGLRQRRTLVFEVSVDEHGNTTNVTFQPPKEIIAAQSLTSVPTQAHNAGRTT